MGMNEALRRTGLPTALAILFLTGCGAGAKKERDQSLVVATDPAVYDGIWLTHVAAVAGEDCPEVIDLTLTSSDGRITGWLTVRIAGSEKPRFNFPVEGQLSGEGQWHAVINGEDGNSFASASGWFRENGSLGLMESGGEAACFWRIHLRHAAPPAANSAWRAPQSPLIDAAPSTTSH